MKKDFNAIGIIPSSGQYSKGTFAHPNIAFEFANLFLLQNIKICYTNFNEQI